jgi:putative endonuclease
MTTRLPEERLKDHNQGRVSSTKYRRPLILLHIERFDSPEIAAKRERFLKTAHGRRCLNNILRDSGSQTATALPPIKKI